MFRVLPVLLLLTSCVVHDLRVDPVDPGGEEPIVVASPVKAHLVDGSTVVFPDGVTVRDGRVEGDGRKYDLALAGGMPVSAVPVTEIAAMESYQTPVQYVETTAATAVTAPMVAGGAAVLALLIFGSCPTIYGLDPGGPVLEAEAFSYSIAPAYEARDVDRLGVSGADGRVALELRNEALETHYVNELSLLEVAHGPAERAYPDPRGRPLVVGDLRPVARAVDGEARDVTALLAAADGEAWEASAERLRAVSATDFRDQVILSFDLPPETREAALVLRLRNSLLNTVLLYELMLADQGWPALDWMSRDLGSLFTGLRLARWYRDRMGLEIEAWDGARYRRVAKLRDSGPIAWEEVAVEVPVADGGHLQVRLSFVTDNWRFDAAAAATAVRRAEARPRRVARVRLPSGDELANAADHLRAADGAYLITRPGDRLRLEFDVGTGSPGGARTWFLATEGYYQEWLRAAWLEGGGGAFRPEDAALVAALGRWEQRRPWYRRQFDDSRIPVR